MEENTMLSIDEYLKELGIEIEIENLTDKEKIKFLREVLLRYGVDRDIEELKFSKMSQDEKTEETRNQYIKKINNLEVEMLNIQRYIGMIRYVQKEKRKLKMKQTFQKAIKPFKRKYTKLN